MNRPLYVLYQDISKITKQNHILYRNKTHYIIHYLRIGRKNREWLIIEFKFNRINKKSVSTHPVKLIELPDPLS